MGNNNNYNNGNNNGGKNNGRQVQAPARPLTPEEQLAALQKATIPINPVGAVFKQKASTIASMFVDLLANTCGIKEADHAIFFPHRDTQGRIDRFDAYVYFDTYQTRGSDQNIWRVGGGNKNQRNANGNIDLFSVVGSRRSNGGFDVSEYFKEVMGAVAEFNDDDELVVSPDIANQNRVAVVKCDFFDVIALCLGISEKSPFDFSVIGCQQIGDEREGIDYILTITKDLTNGESRRGKEGIDYRASDQRLMRNAKSGGRR